MTVKEYVARKMANAPLVGGYYPDREESTVLKVVATGIIYRDHWITHDRLYATNNSDEDSMDMAPLTPDTEIEVIPVSRL